MDNSSTFTEWFASDVKSVPEEDQIGGACHNLGMAKHRFVSLSKRLGRMVGKVRALFLTGERIRIVRAGKPEAKIACQFLEFYTEEEFLQSAMMADATDDTYCLTLFTDDDDMELTCTDDEVALYADHMEMMWVHGKCFEVAGYTKFAVELLANPFLINYGRDH